MNRYKMQKYPLAALKRTGKKKRSWDNSTQLRIFLSFDCQTQWLGKLLLTLVNQHLPCSAHQALLYSLKISSNHVSVALPYPSTACGSLPSPKNKLKDLLTTSKTRSD
ncbi:hypothetical protein ACVRXQ_05750 [Streptococcus panodentis]